MKNSAKKPRLYPGVNAIMKQGSGNAAATPVGNTRKIMNQGNTPSVKSPAGKLRSIMGQ